jgi:ankyrin repeat protein
VKLLFNTQGIDADKADTNGRTPLLWATERGHFVVVKILVGRGDVNISVETVSRQCSLQH